MPSVVTNEARREIGDEGVWSLSSAKPGNGVDQLRDGAVCVVGSLCGLHMLSV